MLKQMKTFINTYISILLHLIVIRHVFSQCSESQWRCSDGVTCIDFLKKCDGHPDCPNESDEQAINCIANVCPVSESWFQCLYGACVPLKKKCDGYYDCFDKSDELFCKEEEPRNLQGSCKYPYEMKCWTSRRQCINTTRICDGHYDCRDRSDESIELCGRNLCTNEFRCAYGGCVPLKARCNGRQDCIDATDEAYDLCNYTRKFPEPCKIPPELGTLIIKSIPGQEILSPGDLVNNRDLVSVRCKFKNIPEQELYCNNGKWNIELPDCEYVCECTALQWMCDDRSACIDREKKCNGHRDCKDGSDEIAMNCFSDIKCPPFHFQCNYGACIDRKLRCNGIADCDDQSDELFCKEEEENTSVKLQGTCRSSNEMDCGFGECINVTKICDGHYDCGFFADENIHLCGLNECSKGFRCPYGGCISSEARCNGTIECFDGADESYELCGYTKKIFSETCKNTTTTTKTTTTTSISHIFVIEDENLACKIPEGLQTLIITSIKNNDEITPGSLVPDDESIRAKCRNNKNRSMDLYCTNRKWEGEFPKCSVFCDPSSLGGLSTKHICIFNGKQDEVFCKPTVLPNATIDVYCALGYDRIDTRVQKLICLEEGIFNVPRLPCLQHCGQLTPLSKSLTRNGFTIQPSIAPWHVSIYRNDNGIQTHICGGSIISPSLVVTAAHCFWNKTTPSSSHLYRIKAGKLRRDFNDHESEGQPQEIEIEAISISDKYKDINNYFYADIAILKLKFPLIYNENISAICMNDPAGDSQDYIKSSVMGSITGYGRSGVLERLTLSTISNDECQKLEDGNTLASDKFCLRNDNTNSTLCMGDSGGGFVEKRSDGYHLIGVISYTPITKQECVASDFVGMSNVYYMRKDLLEVWQKELEADMKLF